MPSGPTAAQARAIPLASTVHDLAGHLAGMMEPEARVEFFGMLLVWLWDEKEKAEAALSAPGGDAPALGGRS